MEQRYSLHGFIIIESERDPGWIQHVVFIEKNPEILKSLHFIDKERKVNNL